MKETEKKAESQGLIFEQLEDGTYAVTGLGTCQDRELVIPRTAPDGGLVTEIGASAFLDCTEIEQVYMSSEIRKISRSAFNGCEGLLQVFIPESVEKVEVWAFKYCYDAEIFCEHDEEPHGWGRNWNPEDCPVEWGKDTEIQIIRYSQGLFYTKLANGTYAVKGMGTCTDTEVIIPPTTPDGGAVTEIGARAFEQFGKSKKDKIISVVIPEGVTIIGKSAFFDCEDLVSVTMPSSVTHIEGWAFQACRGLKSVTIPDGVETIGASAFISCSNITSVTIPKSVTEIGEKAFQDCDGLTSITVDPKNPIYYSQGNCVISRRDHRLLIGIRTSQIPANVTAIDRLAFCDCKHLASVSIPNSVTSIDEFAFWGCQGLTSVTISSGVKKIAHNAFSCCSSLKSITVESDNPTFYSQGNCVIERGRNRLVIGIAASQIPAQVTSVGKNAFYGSGLTSITLPKGVKEIEWWAFGACDRLTSMYIPDSVERIETGAFYGCRHVAFRCEHARKPAGWGDSWMPDKSTVMWNQKNQAASEQPKTDDLVASITRKVLEKMQEERENILRQKLSYRKLSDGTYAVSAKGNDMNESLEIPSTTPTGEKVTEIDEGAFSGCRSLRQITVPAGVRRIGKYAFYGCSGLSTVKLSNTVESIGAGSFGECFLLSSIVIPSSVREMEGRVFEACEKLTVSCEAAGAPPKWSSEWNVSKRPVVWNYKP